MLPLPPVVALVLVPPPVLVPPLLPCAVDVWLWLLLARLEEAVFDPLLPPPSQLTSFPICQQAPSQAHCKSLGQPPSGPQAKLPGPYAATEQPPRRRTQQPISARPLTT